MSLDKDELYATPYEVREAIESLPASDYAKLVLIARHFARTRLGGTVVEPDDLLQDAIVKTLDGRRRWNKKVSIIKHLDGIMESDSGHIVEQRIAHKTETFSEHGFDPASPFADPENHLSAKEELNDILDLFSDDKVARDLLVLKSQGLSPTEVQQKLGIGKTQYETVSKRIRRHYVQYLSGGGH